MSADDTILAVGLGIFHGADGVAWTEMDGIDEISEPGNLEGPDVDVTPLKPTGGVRVYRTGLKAGGEFTITQFYGTDGTRYDAMQTLYASQAKHYWKIDIPDNTTHSKIVWQGRVKSATIKGTGDADDPLRIVIKVRVDTAPVWTKGSA